MISSHPQIIRQGYGMTELSPATHITRMNKVVLGSCGALLPNILCKIVDTTTGSSLPSNKSGEICVKGPMVALRMCTPACYQLMSLC